MPFQRDLNAFDSCNSFAFLGFLFSQSVWYFFLRHSVSVTFIWLSHSRAARNCNYNNCSSSKYDIFSKEVNYTTVMELLRLLVILIFVTLLLAPVYTIKSDR